MGFNQPAGAAPSYGAPAYGYDQAMQFKQAGPATKLHPQNSYVRSPKDKHQLRPDVVTEIVKFVQRRFECKVGRDFGEADAIQEFLEQEFNVVVHDTVKQWWYRGGRQGNVLTVSPIPVPPPVATVGSGLTGVGGTSLSLGVGGIGGTSLSGMGGLGGFGGDFSLSTPAPIAAPPGRKGSNPQGASLVSSLSDETKVPTVVAATRAAWVFNCTDATRVECVQRRLFGCPAPKNYERMNPGDIIYLSNVTQRTIEGPFRALTSITKDIIPDAWAGRYMWQVSVDKLGDNIIRVSRDDVSKITGYGNNRSKIYYFNDKQHRQVLTLLTERGYKDGCEGGSNSVIQALKALSLNAPTRSTPEPSGSSGVGHGKFNESWAAKENAKIPPGQPLPSQLRAWIIEVCNLKKGQDKVNCGYVGDQVKKRFGAFDFNEYPGNFTRLHEFVQSLGFVVEVFDKHPYVHTKFDQLAGRVDPSAISPALTLKLEQRQNTTTGKRDATANNDRNSFANKHVQDAAVADGKNVTLAVILKTMNEILLNYDDRRVNSGQMNDNLKKRFPSFNHQEHGYVKFHEFCEGVGFKVIIWNGHPWVCEK
ncbi:hypothetical protein TrLO_g1749 [Triparma laevis f. longispina]|uniref:DCD domain-containing protein n=1 Tax=Triparma laevis f. longispina TaxID=1714387 RepID=A0A9W7C7Q7_9STRA|nr:hypothetical protein TrLO_g1749 [Triparma laevis f. longispina]